MSGLTKVEMSSWEEIPCCLLGKEDRVDKEDLLMMKPSEIKRLHLIHHALEKKISQRQAAEIAGLSSRQMRRLMKRIRQEGDRGILHRQRGRPSNRRIAEGVRQKVLDLYRQHYSDFGPTLASEKLRERHRVAVHSETLRLWLRQAQLPYRQRKARPHRQWRPRRSCFGAMVQLDGSEHDWLEGRGPKLVLMALIDDATNTVAARFYDHEGTVPALDSVRRWVQRYGIPVSVYLDKHTTYRSPRQPSLEEQLQGLEASQSQFQRAMSELGVEVIHAHSPTAKGRIERLFGTLQDRLTKEMRLAQIASLAAANRFLEQYVPVYNQRFRVEPAQATDLHRRVPRQLDLDGVLCTKTPRRLNADSTVVHQGKIYLVEQRLQAQSVTVAQRLDGSLQLRHRGRSLGYRELPARPRKAQAPATPTQTKRKAYRSAMDHPWRSPYPQDTVKISSSHQATTCSRGGPWPSHTVPWTKPITLENPMIPETYKPDISNLVRSGHFYFGWTLGFSLLDRRYTNW
jgi:transposase